VKTDLNSLLIFAQVAESASFVRAARRLQMPTSTVSRRVADIEKQLGVRLIERSTRSLRLTDVGSELLEHAQRTAELRSQSIFNRIFRLTSMRAWRSRWWLEPESENFRQLCNPTCCGKGCWLK
jgi:DNA-binding transcriptional LysR family regulator